MKLWHALCLVLVVLIATESLVDRKGDTSALEQAQTKLVERAGKGSHVAAATEAETSLQKANSTSWFEADGDEPTDAASSAEFSLPDPSMEARPERVANLLANPGGSDDSAAALRLTTSGSRIIAPRAELIEKSI